MAKNNRAIEKANRNIKNIAKGISSNMDDLYKSTYMSTPQQSKDLQDLGDRISASIDSIVNKNMETMGIPSVSKLYTRISDSKRGEGGKKFLNDLQTMFDDGLVTDDLYGLFMSNRYLRELDNEIDTVCKYMPSLEEALAVQKDCVLSADHFSKDFLSFTNSGATSGTSATTFNERIKDLKKKYNLAELVEEIYEDTSKYGEKFIYRVPYSTAIAQLLDSKPDGQTAAPLRGIHESAEGVDTNTHYTLSLTSESFNITEAGDTGTQVVSESFVSQSNKFTQSNNIKQNTSILNDKESFHLNIEICRSNIIESAVQEMKMAVNKLYKYNGHSLHNIHEQKVMNEDAKNIEAKGNIEIPGFNTKSTTSNDGLIVGEKSKKTKISIPGCVIRKLPRDQVIPIYIDDICMGYYFFELRTMDTSESFMGFKNILGDPLTNMRGDSRTLFNTVDNQRQDDTIRYVAGQLSAFIDKQFVNNNQDLAKEIYMILKYNDLFNTPSIDTIKVTFVPPEDMTHFFFRQDPVTHRGISDLDKALIPAKIYSSLYVTNSIATLTRGQDKRVYYVKQTVDTNIAQTLLNTISQIKQSNFGIRQFQNINNILNITGRFNDYVIPTNASGDPPIQFEVMPGQQIDTPTELMEALKEMAINSTGIPIEIIQARQSVDYAMQLTMSSSKVLRFCYKRQELFQNKLNMFITPIYNYEYNNSDSVTVTLPPPSFINITNTNQLVDNTKNFVNSIIEVEMNDVQDDKLRNIYSKELFKHYLGTHLDVSAHEEILNRCKLIAEKEKNESHSNGGESDY